MHSVPISLFLVLFVRAATGEHSLPSLPEAVQLLQLETIRGLKQTILEKEDENRRLEEIIQSVQMEKEAVTHNHTMMEEEMARILSERENVIGELERRLQFLEKDGTIEQLETRIQGLEMEKSAIEKRSVVVKEENDQRMVAMESDKTRMSEEFLKKQTERDANCEKEKNEIEVLKNKELDELSQRLHQSEMTVTYMSEVMLHSNKMLEEQEDLLKTQASAIQEINEKVKVEKNCSTLLVAATNQANLQEEAITLLKSSLVTSRNFTEISTSGMDQLDVAPFMMEMLESYNKQVEMIENIKTAMEKEGQVKSQTSELMTHLTDLRSALESVSINVDTFEQQAHMIEMQGRSITLLTPLLRSTNSSDILWFDNPSRSTRSARGIGESGVADVATCSCLPRSAQETQLWPVRVDYQCQSDKNR